MTSSKSSETVKTISLLSNGPVTREDARFVPTKEVPKRAESKGFTQ